MSSINQQRVLESSKCYSTKSSKTRQDSTLFCQHCKISNEDVQIQISQLKDKAHQSFMQVLQIQQLHDEELAIMRHDFEQKKCKMEQQILLLKQERQVLKTQLSLLERNARMHHFDMDKDQFLIESIEAIPCKEGEYSRLDESEFEHYVDLVDLKGSNRFLTCFRKESSKEIKHKNSGNQIQTLHSLIKELKTENLALNNRNEQLTRKVSLLQTQIKSAKHSNDSLNKEIKFMSEQVKRLGNDKLQMERKFCQVERSKENSVTKELKIDTQANQRSSYKTFSPKAIPEKKLLIMAEKPSLGQCKRDVNAMKYSQFMRGDEPIDIFVPKKKYTFI